jgi:hypothetical protein
MRGAVMYAPGDVRPEDRPAPQITKVADLNTTAARIGVHGNRYNDAQMSMVGR